MREIFVNPQTGDVWRYGDIFSWPNLARTYEKIAKNGGEEFYSGETMKLMMEDLQIFESILSEDDFLQPDLYEPILIISPAFFDFFSNSKHHSWSQLPHELDWEIVQLSSEVKLSSWALVQLSSQNK